VQGAHKWGVVGVQGAHNTNSHSCETNWTK